MNGIKIFLLAAFITLSLQASCLAATSIKAEVDKTSISAQETLTYKLVITSSEEHLPAPSIPAFKDFRIVSQAQSSSVSLLSPEARTVLVFIFILAPTKAGTLKIEPASIAVKGATYTSEPLEVTVIPGASGEKILL